MPKTIVENNNRDAEIEKYWKAFKHQKDQIAREKLITHYVPLVKYIASRLKMNFPAHIEYDDLVSAGILGLLDAVEKFELERGLKFETYAMSRIRGSIIDELRNLDWAPRSMRKKANDIEDSYRKLQRKFGRIATDEEVADDLEMEISALHSVLSQLNTTVFLSLDALVPIGKDRDNVQRVSVIADKSAEHADTKLQFEQVKEILGKAIDSLPKKIKQMIALYYYEDLNLKEIGEVLGVSESRVCQIHTQAMVMLKSKLKNIQEDLQLK